MREILSTPHELPVFDVRGMERVRDAGYASNGVIDAICCATVAIRKTNEIRSMSGVSPIVPVSIVSATSSSPGTNPPS